MIYILSFCLVKVIEANVNLKEEFEKFLKNAFEQRWSCEDMMKTICPRKFSKIWKKNSRNQASSWKLPEEGKFVIFRKEWELPPKHCQTPCLSLYVWMWCSAWICAIHSSCSAISAHLMFCKMFCNISTQMFCKMFCNPPCRTCDFSKTLGAPHRSLH